jgi:hypothetical protein
LNIEVPFVIAVNATGRWGIGFHHEMEALFGEETFRLPPRGGGEPRMGRRPNRLGLLRDIEGIAKSSHMPQLEVTALGRLVLQAIDRGVPMGR